MKVETKYNIGDTVWYVRLGEEETSLNKNCPMCEGSGWSNSINGVSLKCSARCGYVKCRDGLLYESRPKHLIGSFVVDDIFVMIADVNREGIKIVYDADDFDEYDEHELFGSEEEALAEASRRNIKEGLTDG